MTIDEMVEVIEASTIDLHELTRRDIIAKLRAAEELARTWDRYDGLGSQPAMDAARDNYENAGKGGEG